jgi:hypothetical protein
VRARIKFMGESKEGFPQIRPQTVVAVVGRAKRLDLLEGGDREKAVVDHPKHYFAAAVLRP